MIQRVGKHRMWGVWLLAGVIIAGAIPALAQERVVVYTTFEQDEIPGYLAAAKREMPDLEVKFLRFSTGELAARVVAEKDNPQADVVWGLAASRMIELARMGLLEPYRPAHWDKIPAQFKGADGSWVAVDLFVGAFGINTAQMQRRNLPVPRSYKDLADPRYKGLVVMPNPTTSGTGMIHVVTVLLTQGEEKGWELLKAVDRNVSEYTKSGGAPGRMAAQGEVPIGMTLDLPILQYKRQKYPVELVWPGEGTGYDLDSNGLIRGAKNAKAARRFLDWAISPSAMTEIAKLKVTVPYPGIKPVGDIPSAETIPLIKLDFGWWAGNVQRLMTEWQARFKR